MIKKEETIHQIVYFIVAAFAATYSCYSLYYYKNKNMFTSNFQVYVAMSFYIAYMFHFFLIFRSFKKLDNSTTTPAIEFGKSIWLNSKFENILRWFIIIISLCVLHVSTIFFEIWNNFICKYFIFLPSISLNPTENFTLFAFILSLLVLLWNIIAIIFDFVIKFNFTDFKKDVIDLNWPIHYKRAKPKNRAFFNLLPPRSKYLLGDSIAFTFWFMFQKAVFRTNDFHFVEYVSIMIVIYCLLILYRAGAVAFKYE